jgi:hypothetical protein
MGKKQQSDREKPVANRTQRGAAKARPPIARHSRAPRKAIAKKYVSFKLSNELIERLYTYQLEYRLTNPQQRGQHPGISGAVEQLLRKALKLPSP